MRKSTIEKYLKIVGVLVIAILAGFVVGRYFVPPEVKTEVKIVEKIVVQERTFLSVKTRVRNNVKTVIERVSMPDGTIVEKSVEIDKSSTDTSVSAVQASEASVDKQEQTKTIVAAPKSTVSVIGATNLQLDPMVGLHATTPVGPAMLGGFVLVPVKTPAETAVGISVGVSF